MMTNTYLPHVGGVARSVHAFSESFRRQRHRVLVVAPTFEGDEKVSARIEKHVVRLPAIQQFNGSDFSVRLPLTWLANPVLNAWRPDIVHSHHPYLLGDSALRFAAEKNAPVVFTHHTLHEEYTHYVPFDSPTLKEFVIELCTQYANLCAAVVAPSESVANLIRTRGVTRPIEVIPTGIDVKAFGSGRRDRFRKRHKIPDAAFVVGHLGRLAPEKNLGYLGRAVAAFLHRTGDARFLVVGDGSSADSLRTFFAKEGLADRLIMAGRKTGRAVYDAYAAMDVFAFSSLSETQGMVLVEAMAGGLPVLALDAPGVREVVRDRMNGYRLPTHAAESDFANRLEKLKEPRLRQRLGKRAKLTAREFSRDAAAEKMLTLYAKMLQQTRRERSLMAEDELKSLVRRIELEWSLITQKAGAFRQAIGASKPLNVSK